MKKAKLNLAVIALVLGTGAAFAGASKSTNKFTQVLWGQKQNGTWAQTTLGARCTASSNVCKEYFPSGQDPNVNATGGTVQTANGYIN